MPPVILDIVARRVTRSALPDPASAPIADRLVVANGIRWHCLAREADQSVPPLHRRRVLLLHGTGSSAGSWMRFAACLAPGYSIVAPDLPGHGGCRGTEVLRNRPATLGAFADGLAAMARVTGHWPDIVVGHSAGAALAARLALDAALRGEPVPTVVGLNAALLPLAGWAGASYPLLARLCALNPLVAPFFSLIATDPAAIRRLLAGTGSTIDDELVERYRELLRDAAHVAGTVRMLAQWDQERDLSALAEQLPSLGARLALVAAARDRTVAADVSARIHARVAGSRFVTLAGLGHLAHEEAAPTVALVVESILGDGG